MVQSGNYHSTLCNIPEERKSHLHQDGSLTSHLKDPYITEDGAAVHLANKLIFTIQISSFRKSQVLITQH